MLHRQTVRKSFCQDMQCYSCVVRAIHLPHAQRAHGPRGSREMCSDKNTQREARTSLHSLCYQKKWFSKYAAGYTQTRA